jgi:ASC-1-like (ASCH) protein
MRSKTLWVKEQYLKQIVSGKKTVEVRVAYTNLSGLVPGDVLRLNDQFTYRIVGIRRYPDFAALLANENPEAIAPGLNSHQLLEALHALYPPEKEALGVLAFELQPA